MKHLLIFTLLLLLQSSFAQPPAGQKPIALPNGEAWLVDERWFEKEPPFMEFYKYGEKEGLKLDASALLLLQDKSGYLWMMDDGATNLIRYDGHQFKYFKADALDSTALIDHYVLTMIESPNGLLWMPHKKGFSYFDPQTERFHNYPYTKDTISELPSIFWGGREKPTKTSFFDPEALCFTRAFSSQITDATDSKRTTKTTFNWLLTKGWQDREGNIWTIQNTPIGNGLIGVNPATGTSLLYPMLGIIVKDSGGNPVFDPWITTMCPDETAENIYVGGWRGGLRSLNLKTRQWTQYVQNYTNSQSGIIVDLESTLFILPAPNGCFWVGATHGLALFDPKTKRFSAWKKTDDQGSINPESHNLTNGITDKDGRLWLSLGTLMVHDSKRNFFKRINANPPDGLYQHAVHDAIKNKIWYVKMNNRQTVDGGILYLDQNTNLTKLVIDPLFWEKRINYHVYFCGLDKINEDLYFTSEYELFRYNEVTGKLTCIPIPSPPEFAKKQPKLQSLQGVKAAPDGSLWICIYNKEIKIPLVHYFPNTQKIEYYPSASTGFSMDVAQALFLDSKGRVWIGSHNTDRKGVNCFDPKTGKVLKFIQEPGNSNSLPNNLVYAFTEDKLGRIWMTTEEGLCWYDPEKNQINQAPGFKVNNKFITLDLKGNVWLSGENPACYYPETGKMRLLTPENGMYQTNQPITTNRDGSISWGPYYRFHPDSIPYLKDGPEVRLTDFKVFEIDWKTPKHIQFLDKITLTHTDNFFSITWSALSFTNPEQDQYAYQLIGVDTGWVNCGLRNTAAYTKIVPGNYTFQVKAANREGVWGNIKSIDIIFAPAWYQTLWFKFLAALAIFVAVFAYYTLQLRQARLSAELKQKAAEYGQKEAELNQRIAEVQMSALRSQMNPHFIFNSLNSINRFIQLSDPDTASNYLTKFSRLIRQVLDNSRSDVISLEAELEANMLYLEMESLRFAGQFNFRLTVDENVETATLDVPPLLIQPYLENAVWHGLMQKEGENRRLTVDIRLENENTLHIEIEDNGIGRVAAQALKSKTATKHKSHGMDVTAERLALFQQTTGRKISVELMDLMEENGDALGTKVVIMVGI
jgi:ligand-binding sensor domain-containing protein